MINLAIVILFLSVSPLWATHTFTNGDFSGTTLTLTTTLSYLLPAVITVSNNFVLDGAGATIGCSPSAYLNFSR